MFCDFTCGKGIWVKHNRTTYALNVEKKILEQCLDINLCEHLLY